MFLVILIIFGLAKQKIKDKKKRERGGTASVNERVNTETNNNNSNRFLVTYTQSLDCKESKKMLLICKMSSFARFNNCHASSQ
jgi:hypothetical protein